MIGLDLKKENPNINTFFVFFSVLVHIVVDPKLLGLRLVGLVWFCFKCWMITNWNVEHKVLKRFCLNTFVIEIDDIVGISNKKNLKNDIKNF